MCDGNHNFWKGCLCPPHPQPWHRIRWWRLVIKLGMRFLQAPGTVLGLSRVGALGPKWMRSGTFELKSHFCSCCLDRKRASYKTSCSLRRFAGHRNCGWANVVQLCNQLNMLFPLDKSHDRKHFAAIPADSQSTPVQTASAAGVASLKLQPRGATAPGGPVGDRCSTSSFQAVVLHHQHPRAF